VALPNLFAPGHGLERDKVGQQQVEMKCYGNPEFLNQPAHLYSPYIKMMIQRSGGFLAGVSVDCKDAEELGHVGPPPTRGHRTEPCDLHSFSRQIMRARQKRKWRRARRASPGSPS